MLLSCVLCPKAFLPRCSKFLFSQEGEDTSPLISGQALTLRLQFTKYQQSYAPMKIFMPPTSKKLDGHIASGLFVRPSFRPSVRSSRFLMHSITLELLIWIPHEKIADMFFFLTGLCPFSELWPFEKIWMQSCQQNISKTIEARALKLDE